MRRRNLIFGLLAVATLRRARAQQSKKVHRLAVAFPAGSADAFTDTSDEPFAKAFFGELHRSGYFEGENLLIERYSGEGRATHYPDLARDVVRSDPDLIMAINTPLVLDLKAATTTIPIVGVFALPVETGIVPNLPRPGGNITGSPSILGASSGASGSKAWILEGLNRRLLITTFAAMTVSCMDGEANASESPMKHRKDLDEFSVSGGEFDFVMSSL